MSGFGVKHPCKHCKQLVVITLTLLNLGMFFWVQLFGNLVYCLTEANLLAKHSQVNFTALPQSVLAQVIAQRHLKASAQLNFDNNFLIINDYYTLLGSKQEKIFLSPTKLMDWQHAAEKLTGLVQGQLLRQKGLSILLVL